VSEERKSRLKRMFFIDKVKKQLGNRKEGYSYSRQKTYLITNKAVLIEWF